MVARMCGRMRSQWGGGGGEGVGGRRRVRKRSGVGSGNGMVWGGLDGADLEGFPGSAVGSLVGNGKSGASDGDWGGEGGTNEGEGMV